MRLATPDDIDTDAEHRSPPGGKVRVRVFRHRDSGRQPALVYMHGGGWTQGSPETHWDITARIASWNRQTVMSVDYALAPEHPFPAAVEQCTAVTEWVSSEASALDVRADRLAIGGDSAGANIAAALAISFGGSATLLGAAPDLSRSRIHPFAAVVPGECRGADYQCGGNAGHDADYLPNPADRVSPLAAPLKAPDHSGLPPAFIAVAENDPLRDDGIAYAEALRAAGVPVTLIAAKG